MRRLALLLTALAALTLPLLAQEAETDDKTFLENWLEENLSAAGRSVEVTGFAGALSSTATMERMTIADDEGVWLTLSGAQLDWTRTALLTGRLEINRLTAERLEISRRPVAVSDGPQAAASDFALPELPVSINIGEITAERVVLGAPVLGVAAEMRLDGGGWLEDGAGQAQLTLERTDGAEGRFAVEAAYSNETSVLGLALDLSEGQGGIVATLTGLPGGPPLSLTLAGTGPINDFTADLELATDGEPRLAGQLVLAPGEGVVAEGGPVPLAFEAELQGDPSPLFASDYRAFFGRDVTLAVTGARRADGRLDLSRIALRTDAMQISGAATLNAQGWLERAQLTGQIAASGGGSVLLPISGAETRLTRADIGFDFDAEAGDDWRASLVLTGLDRPEIDIAETTIQARGTISGAAETPVITGHVELAASGIASDDPGIAVLGASLSGGVDFARESGGALRLTDLALEGADYGLGGAVTLATDWTRLDLIATGAVDLAAQDLARFAPLTGQALSGAADLRISGELALPGGPFDLAITGNGRDIALGVDAFDRLFAGASRLSLAARRDGQGTHIDQASIKAPHASAEARGVLTEADSQISAEITLPDASRLADGLDGPLSLSGSGQQAGDLWRLALDASAPGETSASFNGTARIGPQGLGRVTGTGTAEVTRLAAWSGLAGRGLSGAANLSVTGSYEATTGGFDVEGSASGEGLGLGLGALDPLVTGSSEAGFALRRDEAGTLFVDRFNLATPNLTARATGTVEAGQPRVDVSARLRDLALFVPGLTGAFTGQGSATLGDAGWQVSASGEGPGGTRVQVDGRVAADAATAELALAGRVPLGLANGFIAPNQLNGRATFDLRLAGPFELASLSGSVTTTERARASLPDARLALEQLQATANIAAGRATLEATAQGSSGGRIAVSGPVSLTAPYQADLAIELRRLGFSDPSLFEVRTNGALTLAGPLTGGALVSGRIELASAEIQIPETGFGPDGSLDGLRHIGEPGAVAATRARAGLGETAPSSGPARPYGLNLTIDAPNAVFVRGRGLDAELGGSLNLGGTTDAVIAQGGFSLIRGRLDILGNRLVLTEGNATLRGTLDPALRMVAETQAEEVTVRIILEGSASAPTVSFTSSPDLPEDEILARLVFGRGLDQISPFQALKLASAVATLSGKGGAGTIGRLREGFGLDDLDVTTDENGALALSAGTYLTDNIYTDVTVGAEGKAEINLNLSLTPEITAKGRVDSDGNTGIGIFFEKDY